MTPLPCQALESPVILEFSGPDAVRFLNGQMTQDVSGLGESTRASCITNAKGRLEHYVSIQAGDQPDTVWVVSSHDSADALRARLERYLIADEVEVTDLTGQWQRIHAAAPIQGAAFSRSAQGVFGDGWDLWWRVDTAPQLAATDPAELENLRIARGLPAWGSELEAGILPPEAGLDQGAISYQKGCYIGQEVLSRIKSAGKVNRRLALLALQGGAQPGDPLELDGKEIGAVTSVSPDGQHALAWIKKQGFEGDDYQLSGGLARRSRWV